MDGQSQDYTQNADAQFQPAAQQNQQGNQQQQQPKRENQFQGLIDAYENELHGVDEATCPNIAMLVRNELFRLRGGVIDTVDVLTTKKTKVRTKVDIPVEAYPNVNFVGKLLGPAGKTLKTVQEQTNTKMSILGSGSLRNPEKEQELLNSGDPKYNHLRDRLHLQIDSIGNPSEAYYNISYALAEVKKVMIPDPNEQAPGQMPMVTPLMGGPNGGFGGMRNQPMNQQRGGRGRGGNRGSNRGGVGGPPRINNFNPMFMNGANDTGFTDDYPTMGFDNSFESGRGGGKMMRGGGMDRMNRNAPYSRPM
uniref:KHD-1 n=1 Tax=Schmidtea mediterranea TaxID=79327 RepID=H9CXT9_SCHMD|nr:KHD-1 [Schmidtea mediterranea]